MHLVAICASHIDSARRWRCLQRMIASVMQQTRALALYVSASATPECRDHLAALVG